MTGRHIRVTRRGAVLALTALACLAQSGCSTGPPPPVHGSDLQDLRTFPFYRVYWDGPAFDGSPVTATDGLKGYNPSTGDEVEYGDCDRGNGPLHTGGCRAPLQIITVIYRAHCNRALGTQRNILIRGVPATVYDQGRSIEVYTGRVAVDVFADTPARALHAARALRPANAPDNAGRALPAPAYHPGLYGPAPAYPVAPTVAQLDSQGVAPVASCS